MPWECRTVENQRREFAKAAECCKNFSALCREFGITRHTGYKWRERYAAQQPLADRSRRPHTSPSKTPEEVEQLILAVRSDNPGWGARTIRDVLIQEGHKNIPCAKTVNNILHRYNCISPEESQKRQPFIRFEKELCNQMWQTDFKGEFRMEDGRYCYPLDIIDDHSRFAIRVVPHLRTSYVVIPVFTQAFQEFGLPDSILSDNGAQFAGFRKGYTQFERWLMDLDILPIHGRIKHPQTQGKIERFHRTMKQELLNHTTIANIDDAQNKLSSWREKYNNIRPHEALGRKRPGDVYEPSQRQYNEKIEKYEYGGEHHVIKVNNWGYARFDKWQVYLRTLCEISDLPPKSDRLKVLSALLEQKQFDLLLALWERYVSLMRMEPSLSYSQSPEYALCSAELKKHGFVVSIPDDQAQALFSEQITNTLRTLLDNLAGVEEI